jgi:hypothetical protein
VPKSFLAVLAVMVGVLASVGAQAQATNEQLAARCAELGAIADRFLRKTGEGSGGPNMTRLGAGVDCDKGRYEQGIKVLERLLSGQRIPYPPG